MRASDSAQLVQWVSNRLKQPVTLPDLTGSGYRLMGGRLDRDVAWTGRDVHV